MKYNLIGGKKPLSEDMLIENFKSMSLLDFDVFLNDVSNLCNLKIAKDIGEVLSFNELFLKKSESYNNNLTTKLNKYLISPPKPEKEIPRKRPKIDLVHQEIMILQKIKQTEELGIINNDSVTQLGRRLKREYYSVKNILPGFKTKKGKQKFTEFVKAKA